jgi:decaprenylphospho-beta-D-ribofuranose 2-oxidase
MAVLMPYPRISVETRHTELVGWGGTSPTVASVVETSLSELTAEGRLGELAGHGRGVIARGLGRSYGDPAQNGGGTVVRLLPGDDPVRLDPHAGTVTADAGVSLDVLLRQIVPEGWFVPVTPGTRFVTVGGAIASDIHGKNHHADGSFGSHVEQMVMLLADGSRRTITPASDPDLWWATIGGMGLTGIITEATFRLIPIETVHCLVDNERIPNLETLLDRMETGDHHYRYSVAWIDLVATGSSLGRSVLSRGNHASLDELRSYAPGAALDPLHFDPPVLPDVPVGMPNVLNRLAVRAFNEFWYRKTPREHHGTESLTAFFHPLDMVGQWNRLYGRHGFLQYQFVVPFEAVDTLRTIIARISDAGHASFLAVLKRFGAESGGLLSFPSPGWTLTLDLPAGVAGLGPLLAGLDRLVLDAGGRHYLAKDAYASPDVIRVGYPRLDEWKAIRSGVDPDGVWVSDQARRLELV